MKLEVVLGATPTYRTNQLNLETMKNLTDEQNTLIDLFRNEYPWIYPDWDIKP